MANLGTALDAAFWDLNIGSPQTLLEGAAKWAPGEQFPMDGARGSRALRVQQLSLVGNGFPLGIIPGYAPTPHKELGSLCLQSLFYKKEFLSKLEYPKGWLALAAQFRPGKVISSIKTEFSGEVISSIKAEFSGKDWWKNAWKLRAFRNAAKSAAKNAAKQFLDKSIYSIGLCSQIALSDSSNLLLSTEAQGERNGPRTRAMLFHKFPAHDVTVEAGWPELYVDHDGKYWDVPESISVDCSSLVTKSGLRYHFGLHKNSGHPQPINSSHGEVPLALMPGLCAKAAFSYEKSKDLWRQVETADDLIVERDRMLDFCPAYDFRLREPHAAISGIVGGTCAAWFGGSERSAAVEMRRNGDSTSPGAKKRSPFSADLFGSVCCNLQLGKFRKDYLDLTRLDARLDICSASALAKRAFRSSALSNAENQLSSPRLNLIFQQQLSGPIVFRVDSRFLLDSSNAGGQLRLEDRIYSLSYSLLLLESGKVVAWYSPKKKEAMIELRLFEF